MKNDKQMVFEVHDEELGYSGWICVDTLQHGQAFGGCRFDLSVTRDVVSELAKCMTLKLAPHGLPMGGAKGGLRVDPRRPDMDRVLSSFAKAMREPLSKMVVLGKDLGATDVLMDGLYEKLGASQLAFVQSRHSHKSVPTKLRELSGYKKHMTALGAAWAANAALDDKIRGKRVLIQGAGAVGFGAVVRLKEMGAVIVGISDAKMSLFCKKGFSLDTLGRVIEGGRIDTTKFEDRKDALNVETGKPEDLFARSADVLVLAATSNSVFEKHARVIQTEWVLEASNFGLLPEARRILHERSVQTVPDVIASSSSAAMVCMQMGTGNSYSEDELWSSILGSISDAVLKSREVARVERVDMREAFLNVVAPEYLAKKVSRAA